MSEKKETEGKGRGRPPLPPGTTRSARLSMRTYPDVEDIARRFGTEAVEEAIRALDQTKKRKTKA